MVLVQVEHKMEGESTMTKILSHTGNEVYVGHFQGNAMKSLWIL